MVLADLDTLLGRERAALQTGDMAFLSLLAEDKLRLAQRLAGLPPGAADAAALARLRDAARHNDRLLRAALAGLRAARARLDAARRGGPALDTYDQGGQRQSLGAAPRWLERKA
jgi:flagellar biosynthesis/type III secretory pathway chaperone